MGGLVVVEEALGDVEELVPIKTPRVKLGQQRGEVRFLGLVCTNFFSSDDAIERDPEPAIAGGEGRPVDVRNDDEAISLLQA
jgi:hypothetical protein